MTTYIRWPKSIDADFRAKYLAATGEKIQNRPMESEDGTEYMVGSSRIIEGQKNTLKADTSIKNAKYDDALPVDFVKKPSAARVTGVDRKIT